ncbi:MAG: dihydrofolate reductase family protein [bacterium]|nr:dihydrofolate reductase family protein [bacterium]
MEHGLPEPMTTFVDRDDHRGRMLPAWLTGAYGGGFRFPDVPADRPRTFGNFVQGMDGIVSFQLPGQASGGPVSGFNAQDQFLMGVLRAAADAVMVGAGTLRAEPEHCWTPEHIYPKAGPRWAELRQMFGKQPNLINAFVTASGDINLEAVVFRQPNIRCVVFTTKSGAERIAGMRAAHPDATLEVIVVGERTVELPEMLRRFRTEFGVEHLLVEGGPQLMGDFLSQDLMDEIFLTIAPQVIGTDGNRPTFAKGKPFTPQTARWWQLVSAKGWGDYLYTRYRLTKTKT